MIHGHGNNLAAYGTPIRLDFSSNIAFNNHGERINAYLKTQLGSIRNYPDPAATRLTHKLAEHHSLSFENILVTNGSAEAFYLIAHYLGTAKTAICIPAFAEYEDACALYGHILDFVQLENFTTFDFSPFGSVWLGNPNNPNGIIIPPHVILEKCLNTPHTMFIVDQAYVQLTSHDNVDILAIALPKNLIVTHSLTKEFAIPGLRLGYITAAPAVITHLSAMRPPWNVNSLALAAGEFIIDNFASLLPDIKELMEECFFLQRHLSAIEGVEVFPSSCNFFLSRLTGGKGTASFLKERLIDDYGILIRDASNFRGLGSEYFRVAAQNRHANLELVSSMATILEDL